MSEQQLLTPEIEYHALPIVGWRHWIINADCEHHERRSRLVETSECEKCGGRVDFWQDTEEWTLVDGTYNKWRHSSYGPVYGFCEDCPTAYHDGFDCMYVLDLSNPPEPASRARE